MSIIILGEPNQTLDVPTIPSSSTNIQMSSTFRTIPNFPTSTPLAPAAAVTSLVTHQTSASSIPAPSLDEESPTTTAVDSAGKEQPTTFPATNQKISTGGSPLSRSSLDALPTSSTINGDEPKGDNRPSPGGNTSSRGAIVGAVFGGMGFVLLGCVCFVLYSRRKSGRNAMGSRRSLIQNDEGNFEPYLCRCLCSENFQRQTRVIQFFLFTVVRSIVALRMTATYTH